MRDFQPPASIARRYKWALVLLAVAALLIGLYARPKPEVVVVSPDGTYRLEHFSPNPAAEIYYRHVKDMEIPGYMKLYRNGDNHYFGESPMLDFFGGGVNIYWHMSINGQVGLGGQYQFSNVPPVGPAGEILEIPRQD